MSSAKATRVAIIGAGLTGLLAAHGLRKHGFDVAIFERETSLDARRRDWTILIHWAMPMLSKLLPDDILASIPEAICNPHLEFTPEVETISFVNGFTGELLFNSSTPGARRITRQKMRHLLVKGLDINWGRALSGLTLEDDSVLLTFEDGDPLQADYVLGADGASSKMRELLLGPDAARPVPSELMFATGIVKYGEVDKVKTVVERHPVFFGYMGAAASGGIGVMDVGNYPEDMSTWTTFWARLWPGSSPALQGQEAIDYVKEHSKNICEPFKSTIEWTPDGSICYIDQLKTWVTVPFPNHGGRVTLAGDAAHPMLPFRGQGLQHAIQDASNYVDAMVQIGESSDIAAAQGAMAAYDADMVARGSKAVLQSIQEAAFAFDEKTVSKMTMARQGHGNV